MSEYRLIVKLPDIDAGEAGLAGAAVKQALAPLGRVEVFTFDENQFTAHWRPLSEASLPFREPNGWAGQAEHEGSTRNTGGHRRRK